jgi:hypothetical protein
LTKTKIVVVVLLSLLALSTFSAINTNTYVQATGEQVFSKPDIINGSGQIAVAKFAQDLDPITIYFAEQLKIDDKDLIYGLYVDITHSNGHDFSGNYIELSLVDPDNLVTFSPEGICVEVTGMTFSRGGSPQPHHIKVEWSIDGTATFTLYDHRRTPVSTYSAKGDDVTYEFVNPAASASVIKDKGNTNSLTITITDPYFDFLAGEMSAPFVESFTIANNAAGTYIVGNFNVYVDTKGNDQIRACYIITK